MKTNHQRQFVARTVQNPNYWFCKAGLKEEGNMLRRRHDAIALEQFVRGNDDALFAKSDMGNAWHWD
jgi:hypothetical protein